MDVLIVNPNSFFSSTVDLLNAQITPNLGIAYLISSIEHEHRVRLVDTTFHSENFRQYISGKIKGFNPDVVGISTLSFNFQASLKIACLLKEILPDPDIPFIWGGVHSTVVPEAVLSEPLVDAVCIGEGERSFPAYLERLKYKEEPYGVEGIWFKNKEGKIIKNSLRPFIQDLDSLLPRPGY